jgi:hypothetical protein
MPPTFPARRGMRAAWYRGRATPTPTAEAAPADADPVAAPESAPLPGDATGALDEDRADRAEPVAPVRPAFGHPTF